MISHCARRIPRHSLLGLLVFLGSSLPSEDLSAQGARLPASVNFGYPRPSPDGTHLLFLDHGPGQYELVLLNRHSGLRRQLTDHPAMDYAPDWSPDGRQVVFSSNRSGNHDLWLLDLVSDSAPRPLTQTTEDEAHPRLSSDGRSVVFARAVQVREGERGTSRRQIVLRTIADGRERALTEGLHDDNYPEVSPDGTQLIFRRVSDGTDAERPDIILRDMATGIERNLTQHEARDDYPTWSPDGEWIAFASDRDRSDQPGFDIYRVRADGSGIQRLTDGSALGHFFHRPAWSPDGDTLFANRGSPGRLDVVAIALEPTPASPRVVPVARPTVWYPDLLGEAEEAALARSAAPTWLRADATVLVLDSTGWRTQHTGTNGFTCLVVRDEFLSRKPTCFDGEGATTVLPFQLAVGSWTVSGLPSEAIRDSIDAGLASGRFSAPKHPGIAYMLSPDIRTYDPRTGEYGSFPPHVMFYTPNRTEAQLGLVGAGGERDARLPFLAYRGPFGMAIVILGSEAGDHR